MQELDHVSIMKPITKFAATVPHTQRIPEIISMALEQRLQRAGQAVL